MDPELGRNIGCRLPRARGCQNDLVDPAADDPRALRSFFSGQQPWQSMLAIRLPRTVHGKRLKPESGRDRSMCTHRSFGQVHPRETSTRDVVFVKASPRGTVNEDHDNSLNGCHLTSAVDVHGYRAAILDSASRASTIANGSVRFQCRDQRTMAPDPVHVQGIILLYRQYITRNAQIHAKRHRRIPLEQLP